jgi:hypothetical protein
MAAPPPSKKSLNDIKAALLRPALTSHYECSFKIPREVSIAGGANIGRLLTLSCSDASLPGSTLATHELNNDVTGVTQRHAYRRLYDDRADFTFYVDQNYSQIRIFEEWMRIISGESNDPRIAANIFRPIRIKYPISYKETIYITKFERDLQTENQSQKMIYEFYNAFPVSIGSMPVSYESSQLLKVTVSFTYDRYYAGGSNSVAGVKEPSQPTTPGVSNNTPTPPTPAQQSTTNTTNLGNISAGTLTNTNFDSSAVTPNTGIAFGQGLF